MYFSRHSARLCPSLLAFFFGLRRRHLVENIYGKITIILAILFSLLPSFRNSLVALKMNYSYDDSRVLNLWQRLHFNTDSSNGASCRADAWRRLLVQLQTLKRRLACTCKNTEHKLIRCKLFNLTPGFLSNDHCVGLQF